MGAILNFLLGRGLNPVLTKNPLLMIGRIVVPAVKEEFRSTEHFMESSHFSNGIMIVSGNKAYEMKVLDVVHPRGEQQLICFRLAKRMSNREITAEIGKDRGTDAAAAAYLLEKQGQGHGEPGVLLTNGRCNMVLVKDSKGFTRWLAMSYQHGGWTVWKDGWGPHDQSGYWTEGSQIFVLA